MDSKTKFKELVNTYIKVEGIDKLMKWLDTTDFYKAPASTRFHGSNEGGLVEHSIAVFDNMPTKDQTTAIVALFHDICKTNYYEATTRNVKDSSGKWTSVPYYTVNDKLPYGHGEKSVFIISKFINLTTEEAMAIRWHMGGFDNSKETASVAFNEYPLAVYLNVADLIATFINKK